MIVLEARVSESHFFCWCGTAIVTLFNELFKGSGFRVQGKDGKMGRWEDGKMGTMGGLIHQPAEVGGVS